MIWQARGRDSSGCETWVTTITEGTFLITRDKAGLVNLWRIEGLQKVLHSTGFRSVEAAQIHMARRSA